MNENPKCATVEFIDGLLEIVSRFRETLVSAKAFVEQNNDMEADGGDPFEPCPGTEDKIDILEDESREGLACRGGVKVRTHGGRRARVTKETRERIIDALLNRVPKPRMVDVAEEFDVSQTTVSRVWGIYQVDRANRRLVFDAPTPLTDVEFHSEDAKPIPSPGHLDLPIISEGRKPGMED